MRSTAPSLLFVLICFPLAVLSISCESPVLAGFGNTGPFRVEFEFLELDERDARASNPTLPCLAGMKIYFTERPEIELTLWIGGLFDLVGIPLIGWMIQKLVVDNIVCHSLKLGPNFGGKIGMGIVFENEHPVAGAVAKTLALKARDRKRNAEADLDTSMSMACRISVKLASALNLPAGDFYCIFKYGSRDKVDMEKPPEGIIHVSLCLVVCFYHAGRGMPPEELPGESLFYLLEITALRQPLEI
jgi:hypothetical protein